MLLSAEQLDEFRTTGFLLLPCLFSEDEVQSLNRELPSIMSEDSPRRVLEKNSSVVRSVYGVHSTNDAFTRLAHHPRMLRPAMQLLDGTVYVYQSKVNAKVAFAGDQWGWHQDYIFWMKEDGMPKPRAITAAIFLDDVNEFNGPMLLIPHSHTFGVIDCPSNLAATVDAGYAGQPSWIANLVVDLKYQLSRETVAELVERHGMVASVGKRGSVFFFDCNIAHCSATNMSPFNRAIAFITFNRTDNYPPVRDNARPAFLASRDYVPIEPWPDDSLLALTGARTVAKGQGRF